MVTDLLKSFRRGLGQDSVGEGSLGIGVPESPAAVWPGNQAGPRPSRDEEVVEGGYGRRLIVGEQSAAQHRACPTEPLEVLLGRPSGVETVRRGEVGEVGHGVQQLLPGEHVEGIHQVGRQLHPLRIMSHIGLDSLYSLVYYKDQHTLWLIRSRNARGPDRRRRRR